MRVAKLIPKGVEDIVIALCADYERREAALKEHSVGYRVESEYRYYNRRMLAAAAKIGGSYAAVIYIREIGGRIGYARSELYHIAESTYKKRKRMIKEGIAECLNLI